MLRTIRIFTPIFAVLAIFASCKKDKSGSPASSVDKVKDSTIMYSRDIYLWNDQIPAGFDAQSYSDPNKIMEAIRAYSKEPGFAQPVDRWSFAMKQAEWDDVSSGVAGDFGLNIFFRAEGDLRVRVAEKASPAGSAGVRRGWRITKINGNSNMTTGNADFIVQNIYYSNSSIVTFQKPDGSTVDITLNAATYQERPVALDSVYTSGTKKIGYLVFNSFLGDTNQIYADFNRIFNRFAAEGVNEVVVDLRYNGGGYVSVQHKLANYLAPNAANGQVMMKQEFNEEYKSWNSSTNFKKIGSLNLNRIFFVISDNTASASELLINNLKPFMEVKLVGPSKSYGKPVGYFPIPVGDWYIFPVSFRSTNKNGEGSYFNGFSLDSQLPDGLDKDWGDVTESAFAGAYKYITTGSFSRISGAGINVTPQLINSNQKLDVKSFKGAIGSKVRGNWN